MVSGSGLRPAYPHTFVTAAAVAVTPKPNAEDSKTTCDPQTTSAISVAGDHHNVYGDCDMTVVRSAAARRKNSSKWPRPQDVDRPPRWRRRGRSRLYGDEGGWQRLAIPRLTVSRGRDDDSKRVRTRRPIDGGMMDGKSLKIQHPVAVQEYRSQPRTGMKTAGKMLLYALGMFFEQMELTVYLSLYKIKLLYNTLIAPMINSW